MKTLKTIGAGIIIYAALIIAFVIALAVFDLLRDCGMYFGLTKSTCDIIIFSLFLLYKVIRDHNKPREDEKKYTKEQMEDAITFGRNLGMAFPDLNEEQSNFRREEIKKFTDNDFHY
jgi:high-affinity Fe2+/Pb2+ permease